MHDPIAELERYATSPLARSPLPAAEVRRLGTRRRRRRNAAGALGAFVAVAAIGTPAFVHASGTLHGEPSLAADGPTTARPVVWRTSIPHGFPLTDGLPTRNERTGTPVRTVPGFDSESVGPCGATPWSPTAPTEALEGIRAVYSGTEGGSARTLALYPDDQRATRALAAIEQSARTCEPGTADPRIAAEVLPSALGQASLTWINRWSDADGPTGEGSLHEVVQVGNALLLTSTTLMGAGDPAVVGRAVDTEEQHTAAVVGAMCVFAGGAC